MKYLFKLLSFLKMFNSKTLYKKGYITYKIVKAPKNEHWKKFKIEYNYIKGI